MFEDLTKDSLKEFKALVEEKKFLRTKYLDELSYQYWYEIVNGFYIFNRIEKELELLESVKKSDLSPMFEVGRQKTYFQLRSFIMTFQAIDVYNPSQSQFFFVLGNIE